MKYYLKNNAYLSNLHVHIESLKELKSIQPLRSCLSNFLKISENISFRNNTTSAFISVIQALRIYEDYHLVYSDLEHPCIQNAINTFYPKNKTICLELYDLLLAGKIKEIEQIISNTNDIKSIYVMSHVLWNTGTKLDIESMSVKIKNKNQHNIIIIDGAQAIGNMEQLFSKKFDFNIIDFYIGCIHKWLGSKRLLGFIHVSTNLKDINENIIDEIFINDIFSLYAGQYSLFSKIHSMSTYDLSFLLKMTKNLSQLIASFEFFQNLPIEISNQKIYSISFPKERNTRFYGFYGKREHLLETCDELKIDQNYIIADDKLPNNYCWLRLGK